MRNRIPEPFQWRWPQRTSWALFSPGPVPGNAGREVLWCVSTGPQAAPPRPRGNGGVLDGPSGWPQLPPGLQETPERGPMAEGEPSSLWPG